MVHKSPTVVEYRNFDSKEDAEELKNAMKGFGTDEEAIIAILSKRSNKQRQQIADDYKDMYGKDLIEHLKSELKGDMERAVVALMTPFEKYLATEIHEAIAGLGTEEETLVEILAGSSNDEIKDIARAYEEIYEKSLEDAVAGDTSGDFQNILIALAQGSRSESRSVDEDKAQEDAAKLHGAGEGQLGTDESEFIRVMCSRSYPHITEVQKQYKQLTGGSSLKDAVKSEFRGNIEKALLAILSCSKQQPKYFATRIHDAMEGMGSRDRDLIRVIVSRSEIDLGEIKDEFQKKYEKSLEEAIENETSGDFKRLLSALL